MALWSFSEVSQVLGTSIQNISNRKSKLKSMGFIELDVDGKEKINENGYNWLIRNSKQRKLTGLNNVKESLVDEQKNIDNTDVVTKQQNDYIVSLLENQIVELKQRINEEQEKVKYWQELYIKQNDEFKKLAFPPMLDTEDGNRTTEETERKKSFWQRLWGN